MSDVPGVRGVVPATAIVEPSDVHGLERAIVDRIEAPALGRADAEAGRNAVLEHHRLDRTISVIDKIYANILGGLNAGCGSHGK